MGQPLRKMSRLGSEGSVQPQMDADKRRFRRTCALVPFHPLGEEVPGAGDLGRNGGGWGRNPVCPSVIVPSGASRAMPDLHSPKGGDMLASL